MMNISLLVKEMACPLIPTDVLAPLHVKQPIWCPYTSSSLASLPLVEGPHSLAKAQCTTTLSLTHPNLKPFPVVQTLITQSAESITYPWAMAS